MNFELSGNSVFKSAAKGLRICFAAAGIFFLSVPNANAQTFLSNAELLELLPGATLYSKNDRGMPWAQINSLPDGKNKGTVRSVFGKRRPYAKWFVRDGQWCENWGVGETCWRVERLDFQTLRMYGKNGKPRNHLWMLQREDITGLGYRAPA